MGIKQNSRNDTKDFESHFEKNRIEKPKESRVHKDIRSNKGVAVRQKSQTVKDDNDIKEDVADQNEVASTNATEKKSKEENVKAVSKADNTKDDKDEVNEKLEKELADSLNIPVEVIQNILSDLNLTAVDLKDNKNLNIFMQKLLQVDEPSQLLAIPETKEMLKKINEVLANVEKVSEKSEAMAEKNMESTTNSAALANQTESTSDKNAQFDLNKDNANKEIDLDEKQKNGSNDKKLVVTNEQKPIIIEKVETVQQNNNTMIINTINPITNQPQQIITKVADVKPAIDQSEIIKQIVQSMKAETKFDLTELKINLKPDHLGDITLKISKENGIISAQFVAENQKVKEIIESNFNQLKDTLKHQGIEISNLSVTVGQESSQDKMDQFMKEQQKSRKRVQDIIKGIEAEGSSVEAEDLNANPYKINNSSIDFIA